MRFERPLQLALVAAIGAAALAFAHPDDPPAAQQEIDVALADALRKDKRALIVWGASSSDLAGVLKKSRSSGWPLYYEYELVQLEASEANAEVAAAYGADLGSGLPRVTVLDAQGRPLAQAAESDFQSGAGYDDAAIGAFLSEHRVPAEDAREVLATALSWAGKTKRRALVHLGAPW